MDSMINPKDKHEHHVRDVLIRVMVRLFEPQPEPTRKKKAKEVAR